jgi:hypothetical protein
VRHQDDARSAIGASFIGAEVGTGTPIVVTVAPDRWTDIAQFAKETLGCRFFSFLTAVDWKEQGLEVVAKVDNLDEASP